MTLSEIVSYTTTTTTTTTIILKIHLLFCERRHGYSSRRRSLIASLRRSETSYTGFRFIQTLLARFQFLGGEASPHLTEMPSLASGNNALRSHHSAVHVHLIIPRISTMISGLRRCAVSGSTAWNSLPKHLKNKDLSFPIFNSKLN